MIILSELLSGATSIANVNSINNSSEATYKTSEESLKKVNSFIDFTSDKVVLNNFSTEKSIKDYSVEESWLLDNSVLSNDIDLSSDNFTVTSSKRESVGSDEINKSDFLMAVCKGFYGVQESRPIVIHTRNKDTYKEDPSNPSKMIDLSEGNYNVYVTPNVYELYFTSLLNKGFINIKDFKNVDFIDDYSKIGVSGESPEWSNSLNVYKCLSSSIKNQLGYSIELSGSDDGYSSKFSTCDYFMENGIDTIDALKMVEKMLRSTEKDMTDTESKIVSYKYGVDYLMKLDESSKSTIMYLISRGVLNFEDPSEFTGLYSPLTKDKLIKILYRTFNKSARLDFSKVQLTDNDNYWLSKGFYQGSITINDNPSTITYEGDVEPFSSSEVTENDSFLKSRVNVIQDTNSVGTAFTVTRTFAPADQYTYRGTKVTDLKKGKPSEVLEDPEIGGGKCTVKFKISANTAISAGALVDNRCIRTTAGASVVSKVTGIVKVNAGASDSDNVNYYVPQAELEKSFSEIKVLDDLLLMNDDTKARCVLLQNEGVALVGNEVVDCKSEPMIQGFNGETYYNLKLIVRLMSKKYLNSLNPGEVYSFKSDNTSNNFGETLKNIYSKDNKTVLDSSYTYQFPNVRKNCDDSTGSEKVTKDFFSMTHTNSAFSYLYRDVTNLTGFTSDEVKYPIYLVVDWQYVLPDSSDLNSSILGNLKKQYADSGNPSVSSMTNFLSTRPVDDQLGKWWDSNIGLSNSLCNFIYGSSDVKYFSSGYLTPNVTLLSRTTLSVEQQKLIMNKLNFNGSYKSSFVSNGDVVDSLFNSSTEGVYGTLMKSRSYKYIEGFKHEESEGTEYSDYLLDKCNVMYRSYGKEYSQSEQRLSNSGSNLVLKQRNVSYGLNAKQIYKIDNKEYLLTGEKTIKGTMCYQMTALEPEVGEVKVDDSNKDYEWTKNNGEGNPSDSVMGIVESLSPNYKHDTSYVVGEYKDHVTGYPSANNEYPVPSNDDTVYYYEQRKDFSESGEDDAFGVTAKSNEIELFLGSTTSRSADKGVQSSNEGGLHSVTSPIASGLTKGDSKVNYYPVLYLDKFRWKDKGDGVLENVSGISFYTRENLRNVGVSSAVIDSVIDNAYGTESLSGVKDGAKVIVGDLTFTNKNGKLVSDVIENKDLALNLAGRADNDTVVKSELCKLFDGSNINILKDGSVVKGQGLVDYIDVNSGGRLELDLADVADPKTSATNTLIKRNGSVLMLNGTTALSYNPNDIPEALVFSIVFNESIKFRPIDYDKNTWTLCYTSTSGCDGNVDDIPYFTGTIGFTWYDDVFNNLLQSKYGTASDPSGLMDKIKAFFDAQFRNDIYGWLKMIATVIIFYLWIMNLFVFVVMKTMPTAQTFFERINSPNGGKNKGFDILKLLTLGAQSIEREIGFLLWFGYEFLMALLLLIIWKYL